MDIKDVEIGFVERCESWRLNSHFFPNKVGGKPAWLSLENLPSPEDLECGACKNQLTFLCQIYAPYEEDPLNFHRTVFIFVCRTASCLINTNAHCIKAFRSQLPRENKFYSFEPPEETSSYKFNISQWVKLCKLCGCPAEKCKDTNRCDKCSNAINKTQKVLFQEYELVVEPEVLDPKTVDELEQLEKFNQLQIEGKIGTMSDISDTELESHISLAEDKTFAQFQKRIRQEPEQVLRYQRGGVPLWIAREPVPDAIPNCEYCQGPRQFEFQIMPQMLVMLNESELDWGVLCVYTCEKSCSDINCYKNEFIFKQDVAQ